MSGVFATTICLLMACGCASYSPPPPLPGTLPIALQEAYIEILNDMEAEPGAVTVSLLGFRRVPDGAYIDVGVIGSGHAVGKVRHWASNIMKRTGELSGLVVMARPSGSRMSPRRQRRVLFLVPSSYMYVLPVAGVLGGPEVMKEVQSIPVTGVPRQIWTVSLGPLWSSGDLAKFLELETGVETGVRLVVTQIKSPLGDAK